MRDVVQVVVGTLILVGVFLVGALVVPYVALSLMFGWLLL